MSITTDFDDLAVQVLSDQGAQCGDCGDQPGDRTCHHCEECRREYVAALRKAGWAHSRELQAQIDKAHTELAAIKKQLADLETVLVEGPR